MAGTSAGSLRRSASLDELTVADVLIRHPKTLPVDATAAQARQAFQDDHVHMLLLVSTDDVLIGTLVRQDLPDQAADGDPVRPYAVMNQRTVDASLNAEAARQLLLSLNQRRRAVVDDEDACPACCASSAAVPVSARTPKFPLGPLNAASGRVPPISGRTDNLPG